MSAASQPILNEGRKSLRVKENLPVRWRIQDGYESGEGKIINISTTGVLLKTSKDFAPMEKTVFSLESLGSVNGHFLPKQGRLVWSTAKGFRHNRICGLEFIQPEEKVVANLRERIQGGITKVANARRTKSVIGTLLLASAVILSGFVIKQFVENYQSLSASQALLSETLDQQIALSRLYQQELATTKSVLADTQALLAKAQAENVNLSALVEELNQKNAEFQGRMADLEQKNTDLNGQLTVIRDRLRLLEGDVRNMEEGRSVIQIYKQNLRKVKLKINEFKQEAHFAKVAAQKERDRIETMLGNNGFMVKDGKAVVRGETPAAAGKSRVDVDVQFMK